MKQARKFAGIAAAAALGAGIGAVGASTVEAGTSAAKVNVKLAEFKLIPSVKSSVAGKVTFVVRNAGKIPHEFVVLRTKTPAAKLPMKGAKAAETGKVGKIPTFGPGKTKTLGLTLKRGHYVLLCNLPGHYKAGQFADLTVR